VESDMQHLYHSFSLNEFSLLISFKSSSISYAISRLSRCCITPAEPGLQAFIGLLFKSNACWIRIAAFVKNFS
jgi:hypothetical protein